MAKEKILRCIKCKKSAEVISNGYSYCYDCYEEQELKNKNTGFIVGGII